MINKKNNFAYIDAQNLNLGVQALGWKIDWKKFRVYLRDKYHVEVAYLFLGYIPTNKKLYEFLQRSGYVLVFKPVVLGDDQKPKGNIDADLVLKVMLDIDKFDKAVIVTSDGDFYSLIDYLYKRNKLEKVISPYFKTCSILLKKAAKEKIVFLDNLRKKLEYKKRSTA